MARAKGVKPDKEPGRIPSSFTGVASVFMSDTAGKSFSAATEELRTSLNGHLGRGIGNVISRASVSCTVGC